MHMKTHFSSISSYRDLSISDFLKQASLTYILIVDKLNFSLPLAMLRMVRCMWRMGGIFCIHFADTIKYIANILHIYHISYTCITCIMYMDLGVGAMRRGLNCPSRTNIFSLLAKKRKQKTIQKLACQFLDEGLQSLKKPFPQSIFHAMKTLLDYQSFKKGPTLKTAPNLESGPVFIPHI